MQKSEACDIYCRVVVMTLAYLLLGIVGLNVSYAQEGSIQSEWKESNDYAHKLVRSMAKAHGGQKNWIGKPIMKFTIEEYNFHTPSSRTGSFEFTDVYHYNIAIKPANSIGYASFAEDASARIVFDGTDIGTIGLTEGNNNLNKSSVILLFSAYSLINLPWLSQMENVKLKYMGAGTLPLEGQLYEIVRMTFGSEFEHQHAGYYELYIDPETNILSGVKQATVLPKLPGTEFSRGVSALPTPVLHVFKGYDKVDDLIIPSSYVSYLQGKLLGVNFIRKISLNGDFESVSMNFSHQKEVSSEANQY